MFFRAHFVCLIKFLYDLFQMDGWPFKLLFYPLFVKFPGIL